MTFQPLQSNERLTDEAEVDLKTSLANGDLTATYYYDYDYESLEDDEAADAELEFNDRAWNALTSAAQSYEDTDPDGGLEWKWSGIEERGLCVRVLTFEAAIGLLRHGFQLED